MFGPSEEVNIDRPGQPSSGPARLAAGENWEWAGRHGGSGWHWTQWTALGGLQIRETKVSFLLNNCQSME